MKLIIAAKKKYLRLALIYLAAFWSGFLVMSTELIGGRLLLPYFGSSIFVWGGVIAVFMVCLAIGYLSGGYLSLKTYSLEQPGFIFLLSGILLLPVPLLSEPFLNWISLKITDPRYGSLLASFILFGATTITAGTISPFLVRLLVTHQSSSGQSAGILYFLSTLGSAAGTIFTSFYLVAWLEINQILNGLIGLTLVIGVLIICSSKNSQTQLNES